MAGLVPAIHALRRRPTLQRRVQRVLINGFAALPIRDMGRRDRPGDDDIGGTPIP